jgi:hypothetical protein
MRALSPAAIGTVTIHAKIMFLRENKINCKARWNELYGCKSRSGLYGRTRQLLEPPRHRARLNRLYYNNSCTSTCLSQWVLDSWSSFAGERGVKDYTPICCYSRASHATTSHYSLNITEHRTSGTTCFASGRLGFKSQLRDRLSLRVSWPPSKHQHSASNLDIASKLSTFPSSSLPNHTIVALSLHCPIPCYSVVHNQTRDRKLSPCLIS